MYIPKNNLDFEINLAKSESSQQTMSSPSMKSLRIGIIGFGPFAQFLVKTMMRQGHTIRATSRSDYTDLCTQLGVSFFRYINETEGVRFV